MIIRRISANNHEISGMPPFLMMASISMYFSLFSPFLTEKLWKRGRKAISLVSDAPWACVPSIRETGPSKLPSSNTISLGSCAFLAEVEVSNRVTNCGEPGSKPWETPNIRCSSTNCTSIELCRISCKSGKVIIISCQQISVLLTMYLTPVFQSHTRKWCIGLAGKQSLVSSSWFVGVYLVDRFLNMVVCL